LASRNLNETRQAAAFFERATNLQPANTEFRKALSATVGGQGVRSDQFPFGPKGALR